MTDELKRSPVKLCGPRVRHWPIKTSIGASPRREISIRSRGWEISCPPLPRNSGQLQSLPGTAPPPDVPNGSLELESRQPFQSVQITNIADISRCANSGGLPPTSFVDISPTIPPHLELTPDSPKSIRAGLKLMSPAMHLTTTRSTAQCRDTGGIIVSTHVPPA